MSKLFIFSFLILFSATSVAQPSNNRAEQREDYLYLSKQLDKKNISDEQARKLNKRLDKLTDYPLYPYLAYKVIRKDLAKKSITDINSFINRYKGLPFINRFRLQALTAKHKVKNWHDVLNLYRDGDNVKYHCMQLDARYHSKDKSLAIAQMHNIFATGDSLPKSCDKMLKHWKQAGHQTAKRTMNRIKLALVARNKTLAKYLAKSLSRQDRATFDYWLKLFNQPQRLQDADYWQQRGRFANAIMTVAAERLIHQKLDKAILIENKIKHHIGFTDTIKKNLLNRLAIRAIVNNKGALDHWLEVLSWDALSKGKQSQVLRHLVGDSDWQRIMALHTTHQEANSATLEWQYWYAISLEMTGKVKQSNQLLQQIATKRRYYGFLASDKLNLPYSLNHRSLPVNEQLVQQLNDNPYLIRAYELYTIKKNLAARREWYQMVKPMSEEQRITAAQIAHQWGWHNRAIITLTMTEQRDDLDLRFPMPHMKSFKKEAKRTDMSLSWPLAIARQESAFMTRAHSHVGATGLMQLMPGTAKLQAKRERIKYHSRAQLLKPSFNIRLGMGYLKGLLTKFDGNLAVAAAAYNAGPHRVKHWVKKDLPQAQWVETIPYRETREYVKNILAYSVIYQHHLKQQAAMPTAGIIPNRMAINSQ
ncbi:transglycosylase SLT domain-containing protein [Psychrobium sp. 1_MG-2023]|uniref:transglycosylase SLT domain-containing protein n=1 Tax=Psychrobium sp. 1_MG-2023 TaxID=3062624 RepID=UPI000C324E93|nr:transglycosylase SLT domain-containing protein [Psychrobium sp. 1_MG-2023]MDP2559718.1 transglycosylase SLT domain-containing protein [Psychrobium sp. 1_MG-2023]PKF59547.1 hypothetical protein CW748_01885 [Alteromonadales bacterium alter-6D02]